jgi:hypothetical protein
MKIYLIINPGMFVVHSSERTPKKIDPISTCFPLSDASPIPRAFYILQRNCFLNSKVVDPLKRRTLS